MQFDQLMLDENIQTTGIIIGVVFIAGNLIEFFYSFYKKKNYYPFHSLVINFSIALMQQLTDVFNKVIFFAGFYYVQQHYSIQQFLGWRQIRIDFPFSISTAFPFVEINFYMLFVWLFILVVADFCQYWLHRLSHEVNIMWAGHIVHHSQEAYNYSVALRQSFIESIYTWIFYLPLAFFGVPWQLFIMAYAISLIWQFFVHTRFVNKLGWLERVFATPSHHRVHHGKNPQYIDKNYGALFIFWDKLYGSFEPEIEAVDYGITTPLQTQNPVWVNIHHHVHIFRMASKVSGISSKLNIIFGKPDFIPSALEEEYLKLKTLQKPETKAIPILKRFYIFFNFLFTALSGFLLVNYYEESNNLLIFLPLSLLTATSFAINISLLENKKWADYAEVSKLILTGVAGAVLLNTNFFKLSGIILLCTAGCMLFYTWLIARNYKQRIKATLQK